MAAAATSTWRPSAFDKFYRSLLLSKFFSQGWGKPENLRKMFEFRNVVMDRSKSNEFVSSDYPVFVEKSEHSNYVMFEGHFMSPFAYHWPSLVPDESKIARFQAVFPKVWRHKSLKPVCIHFAGTGDHGYFRRRKLLAEPLLKYNCVGSIILENPFYGSRKPKNQLRSCLQNVSDLFIMGASLILEALALMHWLERQNLGPVALSGISMGGHMASLAATNCNRPIALVPCLSWSTASRIFTMPGVLSYSLPWNLLHEQYYAAYVPKEVVIPVLQNPARSRAVERTQAFSFGQNFAQNYPESVASLETLHVASGSAFAESLSSPASSSEGARSSEAFGVAADDICLSNRTLLSTADDINDFLGQPSATKRSSQSSAMADLLFVEESGQPSADLASVNMPSFNAASSMPTGQAMSVRNFRTMPYPKEAVSKATPADVLEFTRGLFDEFTHLGNFPLPVDPSLVIVVAASRDAYVPRDNVISIKELWPECEVRYLPGGHVWSYLRYQSTFRNAIVDALDKVAVKYHQTSLKNL